MDEESSCCFCDRVRTFVGVGILLWCFFFLGENIGGG